MKNKLKEKRVKYSNWLSTDWTIRGVSGVFINIDKVDKQVMSTNTLAKWLGLNVQHSFCSMFSKMLSFPFFSYRVRLSWFYTSAKSSRKKNESHRIYFSVLSTRTPTQIKLSKPLKPWLSYPIRISRLTTSVVYI